MIVTAVDYILTVTRDDLSSSDLTRWTQAVSVAAAAVRKQGKQRPLDITVILPKLGWVVQSASECSVELTGVRDALSMPEVPLFDSFFDLIESRVSADAAGLLDWWWTNAFTAPLAIAYIAVLDVSGDKTVVDMRSVSFTLTAPAWSWLVRTPSLKASVTRSQMVLNRVIYEQIATVLEEKASGLTHLVRTLTMATDRG